MASERDAGACNILQRTTRKATFLGFERPGPRKTDPVLPGSAAIGFHCVSLRRRVLYPPSYGRKRFTTVSVTGHCRLLRVARGQQAGARWCPALARFATRGLEPPH